LPTNCSAMPDLSSLEPEYPVLIALFYALANNAPSHLRTQLAVAAQRLCSAAPRCPSWLPLQPLSRASAAASQPRYAILLLISPIFSIQIFTTSPALRYSPRPAPTPAGVPVSTRSPGCRVSREER